MNLETLVSKLSEFDVITIDYWQCPFESGVPLLTMPNVPQPLHALNPRILMGQEEWDKQRMECYENAGNKCEICGMGGERLQAHELYSYNYKDHAGVFKRLVALCDKCHRSIHSGRLLTLTKEGNVPVNYYLQIVEHCFRLISKYNKENNAELRLYWSYLQALKIPELRNDIIRLIKKYDIKFYKVKNTKKREWQEWKLIWGTQIIQSPYKTADDWIEQMKKQKENDYMRNENKGTNQT